MKKSLVNALVGTLTGSGKRKRAVKVRIYGFVTLKSNYCLLHSIFSMRFHFFLVCSNGYIIFSWLRTLKFSKRVLLVKVLLEEN